MNRITRKPTIVSSVAAVAAGAIGLLLSGLYSSLGLVAAAGGLLFFGLAAITGIRPLVTVGALGLFVAAVAAGVRGAPPLVLLGAVLAAVLAYDFGGTAVDLGEELGREADTRRLEFFRLATSSLAGFGAATASYLVYLVGAGGQPLSAVVLLLITVFVLFVALRREQPVQR
ncbi:DUF7519 family protein [Halovenus halobia]|uniref:DUF7519 family protein n=1 Tax=Halovenus halobia TaxID=3396622 RepID=UPI003F564832